MGIYSLMGVKFQFCKMKKKFILKTDGGNGCTVVGMHLMTLNCTLKKGSY